MNTATAAGRQSSRLSGIAHTLVQQRALSEEDASACYEKGGKTQIGFLVEVARKGIVRASDLTLLIAETFGYPVFDLRFLDLSSVPKDVVDSKVLDRHPVLIIGRHGNRLALAMADPTDTKAVDEIRFQSGCEVDVVVVEAEPLLKTIDATRETTEQALSDLTGEEFDMDLLKTEEQPEDDLGAEVDDAPVVRFIQKILLDAINAGASDIHFEPYEKIYRIRFRIDGVLNEMANPPLVLREKIAARIKVISRLDIAEKRVPQDGRMKLVLSKAKSIDFRVSTLPTIHGEKIVMRILDSAAASLGIEALGYEPEQRALLEAAIGRPHGMVLVTGPTGSGKTVSLYTCLNILNKPTTNISTAEDPAEINLTGINQVNVNEKAGLTFASVLRSFLRQDPDIIMVGEIRDLETAEIGIKAAQTGHLVLSTLHTNDASSTVERLRNMGVAPFNIASSVHLITAQRLVRRLCSCKKPADIPIEAFLDAGFEREQMAGWVSYEPVGCDKCGDTGYKGRVGVYEVLPISDEIAKVIIRGGSAFEIEAQARKEGVLSLRQAGLRKVRAGQTSLVEVLAHTND